MPDLRAHDRAIVAIGLSLAPLAVITGWAISHGYTQAIFFAVGLIALCVSAVSYRGLFIGVMLLGAMNGLPFINTSTAISGKVTLQDVLVATTIIVFALWILTARSSYRPTRPARLLSKLGLLLILWWLFTLIRTTVADGAMLHAANYGRDFLYFGLILALLPQVRLTSRDIGLVLIVAGLGVCLYAAAQIATALHLAQLTALAHIKQSHEQYQLTRVYAEMNDLVAAGLAVSASAGLLAPRPITRYIARLIAVLLLISIVVQLTRALWIGLIAGFLFVSVWTICRGETGPSPVLRRRLIMMGITILFLVTLILIIGGSTLIHGALAQRALSAISNLESSSGTVAIRETVASTLTYYLGGHWLIGLGFVSPSMHYYVGLPFGSIRDPDLGILNAIVTMGAIGALLIYLPVLVVLATCLRRPYSSSEANYAWLRYGGAVWLVSIAISSITLVTLFSPSGLALTGIFLTIMCHPSVIGQKVVTHSYHQQPSDAVINWPARIGLPRRYPARATS